MMLAENGDANGEDLPSCRTCLTPQRYQTLSDRCMPIIGTSDRPTPMPCLRQRQSRYRTKRENPRVDKKRKGTRRLKSRAIMSNRLEGDHGKAKTHGTHRHVLNQKHVHSQALQHSQWMSMTATMRTIKVGDNGIADTSDTVTCPK